MPKMKTHSGTKKKFKRTSKGKLRMHRTSKLHEQKRRNKKEPYKGVSKGAAKRISRALGKYNRD